MDQIPGAQLAVIFGSVARGDHRPDSDVDVLIVADDPRKARRSARELASEIFARTGVPVTAVVVSEEDYERGYPLLVARAKREGVVIWRRG